MLADYHVHTEFSDDSIYPMENVVKDAIRLGLNEICITDHVDYGVKVDWDSGKGSILRALNFLYKFYYWCQDLALLNKILSGLKTLYRHGRPLTKPNVNYPRYAVEIERLQSLYGDQLTIKMGMEFGVQTHTIPQFEALFRRYPFDFIILSIHQVEDKEFWTQEFQKGRTQQEYNECYYEEMLNVVKAYKDYSVLGHMDLIKRYDKAGIYPFEKVKPIIAEILKIVIADGKGIEVNTSSRRYGLNDSTPSQELLCLYRDLGGKIVTIGSDSHAPAHLGTYIVDAKEQLKALGFQNFYTYTKMEPVPHHL